ncbi:T9SS type A sorting domain-containing protein, partial [bacterium]|nr:T9SS type A sorting domain-containing protein [bacterium]
TSDPLAAHANLTGYYNDNELPAEMRNAAKREAIWAKVIGHYYTDALTELAEITDDPDHADNLWAEQMTAIVEFLNEPPTTFSTGNRVPDRSRLTTLHDRIQILNGRHTDQEVLDAPPVVESHRLSKAYPNPFNSSVNIQLALPTNGLAKVEVFNIMGQKVATLIDKPVNAGTQILRWDAANMASGVYVYHLQFENHHESGKLLLLK